MRRRISKSSIVLFLVGCAHPTILAPILAITLSAVAAGETVTGMFRWTDNQGVTHPLRRHLVDVFSSHASPPAHVARVYTGVNGMYTATYPPLPPGFHTVIAHAYADTGLNPAGGGGFVHTFGVLPPLPMRPAPMTYADPPRQGIYHWGSGVAPNGGIINYTFSPTPISSPPMPPGPVTTNRAMSVSDAIYTGWFFSSQVRDTGAPELGVIFPNPDVDPAGPEQPGTFYLPSDMKMRVINSDAFDWDVILHEYGHYLADFDDMESRDAIPATEEGTNHGPGTSNIDAVHGGKDGGMQLAWSEGLATYLGIAAQNVNVAGQNLPRMGGPNPAMANVGDTRYADTERAMEVPPGIDFSYDLESLDFVVGGAAGFSLRGEGEGDELPIARILWDIADGVGAGAEAYDRLTEGHGPLYATLDDSITGIDRIDDVWDYYYDNTGGNDETRKNFGAIFDEHGISPHPVGSSPINGVFTTNNLIPPTFEWERRNNEANDAFQLIIFNNAFSQRVLDIAITGDVTSYTLTNAQWSMLRAAPGNYHFVIAGSDLMETAAIMYPAAEQTGPYWSDAYSFSVGVPALPGDFNADRVVDQADYTILRKLFSNLQGHPDYEVWTRNHGRFLIEGSGGLAGPVPEPGTVALASFGLALCLLQRRRAGRTIVRPA